jgi:transcriptional regulator with XRE-family HTH domain
MTEIDQIIAAIRRQLKVRGLTYRDVAQALTLSEASVKRLFAGKKISLERLIELCRFLDLSLAELMAESTRQPELRMLSMAQERQLVEDTRLLLVAVCALNHWEISDMVSAYALDEIECVRYLLQLDHMNVLQLLPGNRVRLLVARDFTWQPDGPIQRYFQSQCQADFLNGHFLSAPEQLIFAQGMLSLAAQTEIHHEMERLRRKIADLHQECKALPIGSKHGTGILLAMREWEPALFSGLRRNKLF